MIGFQVYVQNCSSLSANHILSQLQLVLGLRQPRAEYLHFLLCLSHVTILSPCTLD